jgi:AcrR family transcriptional regulator
LAKTPKGEQTRARLRAASWELFTEVGFEKATMRAIARRAGLSLGAAYHYVASKDQLVLDLYAESLLDVSATLDDIIAAHPTLEARLLAFVSNRLESLSRFRPLMARLISTIVDPNSPLSPFGEPSRPVREAVLDMFDQLIEGSAHHLDDETRALLPRVGWLCWMALVLFWVFDASEAQAKTHALVSRTIPMLVNGLTLLGTPLGAPFRPAVMETLALVESVFLERD